MTSNDKITDFCTEMLARTKTIHDQSDKLVTRKLAVVLTDMKLWSEVLGDFYFVYQAIESALDQHSQHPYLKGIVPTVLLRTDAFEKDLQYYLGDDWRGKTSPSAPATAYCDRIVEVSQEDPTLLIR